MECGSGTAGGLTQRRPTAHDEPTPNAETQNRRENQAHTQRRDAESQSRTGRERRLRRAGGVLMRLGRTVRFPVAPAGPQSFFRRGRQRRTSGRGPAPRGQMPCKSRSQENPTLAPGCVALAPLSGASATWLEAFHADGWAACPCRAPSKITIRAPLQACAAIGAED